VVAVYDRQEKFGLLPQEVADQNGNGQIREGNEQTKNGNGRSG